MKKAKVALTDGSMLTITYDRLVHEKDVNGVIQYVMFTGNTAPIEIRWEYIAYIEYVSN